LNNNQDVNATAPSPTTGHRTSITRFIAHSAPDARRVAPPSLHEPRGERKAARACPDITER
jgi:hypothetical protein